MILLAHILGLPVEELLAPLATGTTAALVLATVTSCARRMWLRR